MTTTSIRTAESSRPAQSEQRVKLPPASDRAPRDRGKDLARGEGPRAGKPSDARIQAEVAKFQRRQEQLRRIYAPKLYELAAAKALRGGVKELEQRREAVKSAWMELEKATKKSWPREASAGVRAIDRAYRELAELVEATGGKAVTDKKSISEFSKVLVKHSGLSEGDFKAPEGGMTKEIARQWAVAAKVKLYKLEEWKGFEFKAAALCGCFGSYGGEVRFSSKVPQAVREQLRKDPHLKARRDEAMLDLKDEHGSWRAAYNAVNRQLSRYNHVKPTLDACLRHAVACDLLRRADRQVLAALDANAKDWIRGNSYPAFKKVQQRFLDERNKAFAELKKNVAAIQTQRRKEEFQKRSK